MIQLFGKYNKDCKVFTTDVDGNALSQVQSILDQEVSKGVQVRIMPDVHYGSGVCVGFSMPLTNMLNPKHIGVDISCGMVTGSFSVNNKFNKEEIDNKIKRLVPMGFNINEENKIKNFPYNKAQVLADTFTVKYNEKFGTSYTAPTYNEKWLTQKLKDINMDAKKFFLSIGTLGSGNHFIEIGKDETDKYWATVHCGSRNFGLKIAEYWTNVANGKVFKTTSEYTKRLQDIVENTPQKKDIPQRIQALKSEFGLGVNKEYLKGDDMMGYLHDMVFANIYASLNRETILNTIKGVLGISSFDETIESVHNYIDFNDFIIRKGAISSYVGQKMIIPFNMRDGLLICEGKSNSDYNFSAPHGSGRKFSRSKAKETIDLEMFEKSMVGIYSTSVTKGTIDESPMSYKDSKTIETFLEPTATIIHRVKPVINIKDTSTTQSWKERKAEKKKSRDRDIERQAMRKLKNK